MLFLADRLIFVPATSIASHFGRIDALRWTPQMEEALHLVTMNKSCPADQAFAVQVRLQLLAQRAALVLEQHEHSRSGTAAAATSGPVPGFLFLKALRGQLQELRASFSEDLHKQGKRLKLSRKTSSHIMST